MKTEKIGRHRIELYDSIDELTTERFFTYNKMLLIDSGIGSDMQAIDDHITRLLRYLKTDKKEEAAQELINMRSSFYFVIENLSPKYLSFAALVYKVDGKLVTDFSDENLTRLVERFSSWGADVGFLDRAIEAVKKKLKRS